MDEDLREVEDYVRDRFAELPRAVEAPALPATPAPRRRPLWPVVGSAAAVAALVAGVVWWGGPSQRVAAPVPGSGAPSAPVSIPTVDTSPDPAEVLPTLVEEPQQTATSQASTSRTSAPPDPPTTATSAILAALPKASDYADGLVISPTIHDSTNAATAMGAQVCDPAVYGGDESAVVDKPSAVEQVNVSAWAGPGNNESWALGSADVTISQWLDAAQAWADLKNDTGRCRWFQVQPSPWTGKGADHLTAAGEVGTFAVARVALIQVGNYIVSVFYTHESPAEADAESKRLAELVAANLAASS